MNLNKKKKKIMESNSKSNKTTNDSRCLYLPMALEDVQGVDEEGRDAKYLDVAGYGLDTENRNV